MATTKKLNELKLPKGYAWRLPDDIILQGDEALVWDSETKAAVWVPIVNSVGRTPQEAEFFVRTPATKTPKAKPAPKTDDADTGALPE